MQRFSIVLIVAGLAGIVLFGCDMITGGTPQPPPPPPALAPPGQPVPLQPGMPVPQPGVAVPGQPVPVPQPGMPAPVPGQPVAVPQPGMPAPVPGLPAPIPQPGMPAPVPGQPVPVPQPGVAAPIPAPAAPVAPPVATGDALTDKLNAKKFTMASAFSATSALTKQTLAAKGAQSYQVQLPGPPYCHTYIAVGDNKVANIDISVDSPTGTTDASDNTQENTAIIQNHCPTMPGAYKLTVNMANGSGEFAVQVFSK
ncbi:MAG: hypothetical protein GY854_06860 [Deltaproteobacteria bacterium]|nr:hypothetical protein [Deltaproteobacteria bacterium]